MKTNLFVLSILFLTGCAITRADSGYELNRRVGLPIPGEDDEPLKKDKLGSASNFAKTPYMPARLPPVVERVWLFDRKIGNYWQQGTWIWVEVAPGRWLNETDPGGAPLLFSLPKPASSNPPSVSLRPTPTPVSKP